MSAEGFFSIDAENWHRLTDRTLNESVAYLVLACGTGKTNKVTRWSTKAVMGYGGMGWERAKAAIGLLISGDFIREADAHTVAKPRYELLLAGELAVETRPANASSDKAVRQQIWVPNAVVTGTSSGEESPLSRLRSFGCIWTLRLFIDLYSAQNLRDDGGISPNLMRRIYERKQVGTQGAYSIWAFRSVDCHVWYSGCLAVHKGRPKSKNANESPIWESLHHIQRLGLLSFVPHVFENDTDDAEPLHVYGVGGIAEASIESEIGRAAYDAAVAMCLPSSLKQAIDEDYSLFCPVICTKVGVQLIGIARLTYRPHTRRTAQWFADLNQNAPVWIATFRELSAKAVPADALRRANYA